MKLAPRAPSTAAAGEEPDEEMLAKCQDIAREEFANQATLEDENSY